MAGPLAGQVALVTGAARGIGRAIARKLAEGGADVAVNYYNSHDEAEALCAEIRSMGRRATAIQGSVGVPESVAEIFAEFGKHFDRVDIVVSNAASGVLKPVLEMGLKHWRWCLETNALAVDLLAQHAVPLMKNGGRIIAMSSLGSTRAMPNYGFIGASKAALEALVRALAQELGPRGIRVNTVSPGSIMFAGGGWERFRTREAERFAEFERREFPWGRLGTPEEVANVVAFVLSERASWINGTNIAVDGAQGRPSAF